MPGRPLRWIAALLLAVPAFAQQPSNPVPVNPSPGTFRFAILPDRTGSNRPGVYESALTKLNLLQPDFVLSTGDLIDGYTTDPKVLAAQWDEFDALVSRLQMRFHYVPGNHDISNPVMLDAWKRRHGPPWSSFVYQDVLFLILHTEDRPLGGIGAEQIAWLKETLAANASVRWTLVFCHQPLWRESDQRGFEQRDRVVRGLVGQFLRGPILRLRVCRGVRVRTGHERVEQRGPGAGPDVGDRLGAPRARLEVVAPVELVDGETAETLHQLADGRRRLLAGRDRNGEPVVRNDIKDGEVLDTRGVERLPELAFGRRAFTQ